ncbi:LysR family transcriptional regulator [Massilia putida]|uniref:LysR family transcriptional regulator n=1 Tax=Massilia putida TaxID=1141883 RepID=UPI00095208B9|nr:LysR family transcriptional regulator [Massilia putida]
MRFKRLDLNLVVALDALLAERSVTRAGQRLNISQTTLSDALGRLRDYFNDELLIQVGRKMVPTPLGESLVGPARNMLLQAEAMVNTKPSFDPGAAVRSFTLMMSDYISTVLISKVAPALSRIAPHVTLDVLPHSSVPWESLARGETDFLIMPQAYLSSDHPSEPLFDDSFVCIVATDNELVGDTIDLEQFMRMGHVLTRFGNNRTPSIDEWFFKRFGNERRIEMITMGFYAVPQAIVGTNRIATIQRTLADYYATMLPIRVVDHLFELPTISTGLQWNRFADSDPGMAWMRSVLREHSATIHG